MNNCNTNGQQNKDQLNDVDLDLIEEHFLPPFGMHNYMFNRSLIDTEHDQDEPESPPPNYEDRHFQPEIPNSPRNSIAQFVDPTINPDILVLNNLGSLQRLNLPIKLTIILTKQLPNRNTPSSRESPLKVYSPGDIVTGYVLIENTSKDPIPFEMFLVSLDGTVTTRSQNTSRSTDRPKIFRKTFLNMYDITACHHYGTISSGPNTDCCGELCPETGAVYGFKDDKLLRPGQKHKKVFTFRMPSTLLDTACEHQSPEHLSLPSSFGVDCESFNGASRDIEVDRRFGYGHLGIVGSPIKKNDLAGYGQSVSYYINVQMIGKRRDFYKQFYTKNIKDDYDFIFVKELQHFFRFSTAGSQLDYDNEEDAESVWHFTSNFTSKDQIQQLEKLCKDTTEKLTLRRDLIMAGVTDVDEQNNIIDCTSEKKELYQSKPLEENPPDEKCSTPSFDINQVSNTTSATLVKGVFSKTEVGELTVTLSTNKKNLIQSGFPKKLHHPSVSGTSTKSFSSNKTALGNINNIVTDDADAPGYEECESSGSKPLLNQQKSQQQQQRASSSTSELTPSINQSGAIFESIKTMLSSPSDTPVSTFHSSSKSKNTLPNSSTSSKTSVSTSKSTSKPNSVSLSSQSPRSTKYDFKIDLIYNPKTSSRSNLPPKSIKINPKLQILNLQSTSPIPITIDSEFLKESTTTQSLDLKINAMKWKFINYMKTWKSLSEECKKKGYANAMAISKQLHSDLSSLIELQLDSPGDSFGVGSNGVGLGGIDLFHEVEMNLEMEDREDGGNTDDEKEFIWKRVPGEDGGYIYRAKATFSLFLDESKLIKRNTGTSYVGHGFGYGGYGGENDTASPIANSFMVSGASSSSSSESNSTNSKAGSFGNASLEVKDKKSGSIQLVPSFQTCYLGRFYNIKFEVECGLDGKSKKLSGKDGRRMLASLPIDIV
ncbi:unnamed protein product [Ambrosiozyma monospora]|uniref:Unnamed protein product n=1 Tax=Ambrosiozyma monospora TaxID=43982 RepID=A0ACB5SR43_AMBMO|nr:unnamed protein product [Ambrosiozyma monospora]